MFGLFCQELCGCIILKRLRSRGHLSTQELSALYAVCNKLALTSLHACAGDEWDVRRRSRREPPAGARHVARAAAPDAGLRHSSLHGAGRCGDLRTCRWMTVRAPSGWSGQTLAYGVCRCAWASRSETRRAPRGRHSWGRTPSCNLEASPAPAASASRTRQQT